MTETIVCESRLKKYGEDAFMRHREEVCAAVRTVCFCLEFLQNEENGLLRGSVTVTLSF